MTAEAIGKVVADLKAGRVRLLDPERTGVADKALSLVDDPAVVDCTGIYRSLVERDEEIYIYEDHPSVAPPFDEAAFCYANEHGNVVVMHATQSDPALSRWRTAEPVDWDDVRWITEVMVWLGGRSDRGPFPTTGPAHLWRIATGSDGTPLDIRWVKLLTEYPMERWDMAQLVVLGALNFLNCRNVEIVEPARPRAERRRVARTGVKVNVLNVFPSGSSSSSRSDGDGAGVPLTSVRGHFAHYGDCCPGHHDPKGKLFGRLSGRFWIPQHARGTAELGTSEHSYRLVPDDEREAS